MSKSLKPYGPKGKPIKGSYDEFIKDLIDFFSGIEEKYPDIAHVRFFHRNYYIITSPEYIQHILQTKNKHYQKGKEYKELKLILGNGLLNSEGDFWLRQRRLAQPAFHKEKIEGFIESMNHFTKHLILDWKSNPKKEVEVHSEMMKLTLEIVSDCMFGTDVEKTYNQVKDALEVNLELIQNRIRTVVKIPIPIPTSDNKKILKSKKVLDTIVYDIINMRLKNPKLKRNDLLQMFMESIDEESGEKMNKKQLRDEVMTMFLAGHETTANALSWGLYLLAKNKEVYQKMRTEVFEVIKDKDKIYMEDIKKMPYTALVCKEILRIYPPAFIITRRCVEPDKIGNYEIPKNSNIIIPTFSMHRSKRFWDKPKQFIPERFVHEKNIPKFAYFPFGGGPRLCIGNTFALSEMQVILPLLVKNFSFHYSLKNEPEYVPQITLRPKHGIVLKVKEEKN